MSELLFEIDGDKAADALHTSRMDRLAESATAVPSTLLRAGTCRHVRPAQSHFAIQLHSRAWGEDGVLVEIGRR